MIFLFLVSCATLTKKDIELLENDKKNKILELFYLSEIKTAQENEDFESFNFYLQQYFEVERLNIPENLKKSKMYFQGGDKIKY